MSIKASATLLAEIVCYGTKTFIVYINVWLNLLYSVRPKNRILRGIYMVVCYRIVLTFKSKEQFVLLGVV